MSDLPSMPPPPVRQPEHAAWQPPAPKRPGWATAIGVISLVLAGLGLLCSPVAVAMRRGGIFAAGTPDELNVYEYLPEWYGSYELGSVLVGIVLCVILLTGGISLLRQRRGARALHLTWAGANAALCILNMVVMASMLDFADMPPILRYSTVFGLIIGIPVGLAYPVFLLIWFGRRKIRQQVLTW